jgi:N-acetylglutamate synthase-like GNAT family acetyltransferase
MVGKIVISVFSFAMLPFLQSDIGLTLISIRFLVMATNTTPHISPHRYRELRSGGTLRDGWSFLVPPVLEAEVEVAFSDDELQDHIREQSSALKALYLSSTGSSAAFSSLSMTSGVRVFDSSLFNVEEEAEPKSKTHFIVKRGLQVVGVATYSEETGQLTDVAIRPTAQGSNDTSEESVAETLVNAVKKHARKLGRSGSLIVHPRSHESMILFEQIGFAVLEENNNCDEKDKCGGLAAKEGRSNKKHVMTLSI